MMTDNPSAFDVRIYGELPPNLDELPILTASQAEHPIKQSPCLMETKEFIKYFNKWPEEKQFATWKITHRTLLFYSSSRLRVMPHPLKRAGQGHRGFYVAPVHLRRLRTIQWLKQKHFLPLWLIREVIAVAAPRELDTLYFKLVEELPTGDFLDTLPLLTKTFPGNLFYFQRLKSLVGAEKLEEFRKLGATPGSRLTAFYMFQSEAQRQLENARLWLESEHGEETFDRVQKAQVDPEVKRLTEKIEDYKKRLQRRK
ncbi:MAG: hypothetical protein HY077_09340 [Elusimicrobia bacterium]|nr:hypothetical protein [Elusimicrobiota bacterium]